MHRAFRTNLLAAGALAFLRPAAALKRRGRDLPDGTRRCAEVNLRGEASKFVLSALGLNITPTDVPTKLQDFLRDEPALRWSIAHGRHSARPRRSALTDVALATFNADGSLSAIDVTLDREIDPLLPLVSSEVVKAYNRSRHEDDVDRPERLVYEFTHAVEHHAPWPAAAHLHAARLALRILRATWFSFDDNADRFTAPNFHRRKHGGLGALNVVARPAPDGRTDLWLQAHHAALDGRPVQDALNRLSARWGKDAAVVFPADSATTPRLAGVAHGRRIERTQDWIDFAPLLRARKALEARLDTAITGRPHLSALLLWQLARQPEFAGRRFSLIVELPASAKDGATYTFLPIRPADFFEGPTGPRVAAYVREFNRVLTLTRRRQGPTHRTLARLALLPPRLLGRTLAHNRELGERVFGTFGVTMLRDAEAFLAPMADVGFDDGFLAIGNMNLPSVGGERIGCASFAAPGGLAASYPAALRRAIADA